MDPLSRIEEKLDRQGDRLNSMDVTLARQNVTLEEHIKRTAQIEGALQAHFAEDDDRLKPLEEQHQKFLGAKIFVLAGVPVLIEMLHLLWPHK